MTGQNVSRESLYDQTVQSNFMIYAITSQRTQYFGDMDFYMAECSNRKYKIIVACPDKSSFIVQFNDDVGRLGIGIAYHMCCFSILV